ncbi:hypothetical protein LJR235_005241 [Pararhizobium sp. LjRoot235]|uniref:hypothetical protein n=1 Tax=Pararhizobium sp. LjRoot235 TaxID=3342291 RepID=UPI003ECEC1DF
MNGATLEIIAVLRGDQQSASRPSGGAAATPLPHSPADVIGVMNPRGVRSRIDTTPAAIVVAEVDVVSPPDRRSGLGYSLGPHRSDPAGA